MDKFALPQERPEYVVCIIDILGQSSKLYEWSRLRTDNREDAARRNQIMKDTAGTVERFHKMFLEFFEQLGGPTNDVARYEKLSHENKIQFNQFKKCDLSVSQFSDTFIFYALNRTSTGDNSSVALYRMIGACSLAMMASLSTSMAIRGGIAIGEAIKSEYLSGCYGPALAEANHLEKNVSQFPRIVLSESATNFIQSKQRFSKNHQLNSCHVALQDECKKMICKDQDGRHIVDCFGQAFFDMYSEADSDMTLYIEAVQNAYRFVHEELEFFIAAGKSTPVTKCQCEDCCKCKHHSYKRLAKRYSQLEKYIRSRLPIWGLTPQKCLSNDFDQSAKK